VVIAGKRISIGSLSLLVVGLVCIIAGSAAVYTTANGPWGAQDSVAYIVSARSLMMGHGLMVYSADGAIRPLAQFPPLYPALLSVLGRLGSDLVAAARWLNISLLVLTLLLAGLIFIRHSSTPALSIPACLLLAAFPTTLRMFSSSLSEPLFLWLLLSAIFSLLEYSRSRRTPWLVVSAALTSLVPLTRYAGVALLPAMAIGILLFGPVPRRSRIREAILFGITTSLPILIWAAFAFLGNTAGPRPWQLRLDWSYMSSQANDFAYAVMQFLPTWLPFGSKLLGLRLRFLYGASTVVFLGMALAVLLANRQCARTAAQRAASREIEVFVLSWCWAAVYFAVLALSALVTAPLPPAISNRMLLPIYIGLVLAVVSGFAVVQAAWFTGRWSWLRALPWAMALWGLLYYLPQTIDDVALPLHAGSGPTSYIWRDSDILAAVRRLPEDVAIVSNHPYTIELWAERPALGMLENMRQSFIDQDSPYGFSATDPAQAAFREGAALVIFEADLPQQLEDVFGRAGRARLETLFDDLSIAGRFPEGVIYYYR
jgi:hypothetical protein